MNKRKIKFGLTSIITLCIVLVCVFVLNSVVSVISDKLPMTIDLTRDKVYKFSEQTNEVMKNLDEEVKAYALIDKNTQSEYIDYIKEYLDKYIALSDNFKVEYVNPYENPAFMQKYNDGDNQAAMGSVIIECGSKFKVITFEQLYQQNSYSGTVQIDMEKKVTNAVMLVTGKLSQANIYFTEGHSEYEGTNFKNFLRNEGYKCDNINLANNDIPEDISILISLAPEADFTEDEIATLDSFMDNGGRYLFVATPGIESIERIDAYLQEWGIKLNYDYVVETDKEKAMGAGNNVPIPVPDLVEHGITEKIKDSGSLLVMPDSMSATLITTKNYSEVKKLLLTSEASYGKKNLYSTTLEKENGDINGPMTIAAISEEAQTKNAAIVFLGSLGALETNGVLEEGAYLNGDFALNIINYLGGSNTDTGIRAKQISPERMTMTQEQILGYGFVLQYIIPLIILIAGLIIWLIRRHK